MIIIITVIIIFIILLTFIYAGWLGAPWVPTHKIDIERFLKLANIKPGQKMYDLGCGDGRLLCAAARSGAKAYGFELSILPFIIANIYRLLQKNKGDIKIFYADFWRADLSDADIIYFFLMPKVYPRLKEKLEKELKKGARVITYVWPIPGWTPVIKDELKNYPNMFLYQR